jgi:hypothetical protein
MHLSSTVYRTVAQHADGEGLDVSAAAAINDHYGTRQPLVLVVAHVDGRPDDAAVIWYRVDNADGVHEYDRASGNLAECMRNFCDLVHGAEFADNGSR